MGDIADMMINGDMDFETGEYLGEGGGYPRTAINRTKLGKTHKNKSVNGIMKFMGMNGFKNLSQAEKSITKYCEEKLNLSGTINQKCEKIQEDFSSFVKWIKKQ